VTNNAGGDLFATGVAPPSAPVSGASAPRNAYHTTLSNTLANLDMNAETRYDLRNEDLEDFQELGRWEVKHVPTKTIMVSFRHFLP
jgi:mitogen-activated protein kinase kinase